MEVYSTKELKSYIYGTFDEVSLMAYFFQIDAGDIANCLINGHLKVKNVLRDEKHGSLTFYYTGDRTVKRKVRAKDWGDSRYDGDLIHIAGICFALNPNNKKDFIEICKRIISIAQGKDQFTIIHRNLSIDTSNATKIIDITSVRKWNAIDLQFWNQKGLNETALNKGYIYPVETARIFSEDDNYHYTKNDPCYAMYLDLLHGVKLYKLYFPFRKKGQSVRFITNSNVPIEAMWELGDADVLILTKSRMDALAMRTKYETLDKNTLIPFFLWGSSNQEPIRIVFSSFLGETIILSEKIANILSRKYPIIITVTDFDRQGKTCAYIHKRLYGWNYMFLTNGTFNTYNWGAKDFTDLLSYAPIEKVEDAIFNAVEYIKTLWNDYNERTEIFN